MVLITTLNPCIDKTLFVHQYQKGRIIKAKKTKVIAGGKGNNVARVLNHLGIKNVVLNFLGGHYGKIIEDCLKKDKIDYRPVWTAHPSRTVVTVLEKDLKQTAFAEPGPKILDAEKQAMVGLFQKTLQAYKHGLKAVVLSGSVPDQNCISMVQEMAAYAKSNAVKVLLDSSGAALRAGLQSKPFLVKPNIRELGDILQNPAISESESQKMLLKHLQSLNDSADIAVLTLGQKGALASSKTGCFKAIPPLIDTVNPVGSGDSFMAGYVYGMEKGMDIPGCLTMATAAGSANAAMWDAASCSQSQIMDLVDKVEIKKLV